MPCALLCRKIQKQNKESDAIRWSSYDIQTPSIDIISFFNQINIFIMENNDIEKGKSTNLEKLVEYAEHSVVSKTILKKETGNISLFSFDKNEGLSEHTAPFDAVVQILDGKANIIIGNNENILGKGDIIIMPANISHALKAIERFKMMLIMIKSN